MRRKKFEGWLQFALISTIFYLPHIKKVSTSFRLQLKMNEMLAYLVSCFEWKIKKILKSWFVMKWSKNNSRSFPFKIKAAVMPWQECMKESPNHTTRGKWQPMRPKPRALALIGRPARRCMGERGREGAVFAVMEGWKDGSYRLPWQELLSC